MKKGCQTMMHEDWNGTWKHGKDILRHEGHTYTLVLCVFIFICIVLCGCDLVKKNGITWSCVHISLVKLLDVLKKKEKKRG